MKDTIITFTKEQVKAIADAFSRGESITIEPPKPVITKWEPKGGDYCILKDFSVALVNNNCTYPKYMTYQTQEQAEQAAKALRLYARQLAWLEENSDGWKPDWKNIYMDKYYIYYDEKTNNYGINSNQVHKSLNTIYMSKENAQKLCQLLNEAEF